MRKSAIFSIALAVAGLGLGLGTASADPTLEECKAPFKPAVEIAGETGDERRASSSL